jgi:hypothetical protein
MRRLVARKALGAGLALAGAVAVNACGSGGVTGPKIEQALSRTFANLVHIQEVKLGLPSIDAAALRVSPSCHKVSPNNGDRGAGTWRCSLLWYTSRGSPLRDSYELSVSVDGCFTATVDGAQMGGPTLTKIDGTTVTNLLYVFDGCFDAT